MTYDTLLEIVGAMHLSQFVESKFLQRSGMFLVAPPGAFKTTITEVMDKFSGTQVISDINVQTLVQMKEEFLSGKTKTLAFSDFTKLYKRHGSVASNLEGIVMALADEGFRRASFQNQSISGFAARCTIIGGMTSSFYEEKADEWIKCGFMRRFIFVRYIVRDAGIIENAAMEDRFAHLSNGFLPKVPSGKTIPNLAIASDMMIIQHGVRHQRDRAMLITMLRKILSVLKWKFGAKHGLAILEDFLPCLSKDGGIMEIKEIKPR